MKVNITLLDVPVPSDLAAMAALGVDASDQLLAAIRDTANDFFGRPLGASGVLVEEVAAP